MYVHRSLIRFEIGNGTEISAIARLDCMLNGRGGVGSGGAGRNAKMKGISLHIKFSILFII